MILLTQDLRLNFKLSLLIFLLLISACGVKGDPSTPQGAVVPSLIENYPDIHIETPLGDNRKFK